MDSIDALRLFARLAERGSFSAAAKDLGIKQSTASKWIAALEERFGTRLVERTTRSVRISEAGQRLLERAQEVLAGFDALHATFETDQSEPRGRVRISVPVVFGRRFVVPALAAFMHRFPHVSTEIVMNDRYINLVDEGFDLAIRVGVPRDSTERGKKLADSHRILVASPTYLKAHGHPTTPADLRNHECLLHDTSSSTIWRFGTSDGPTAPVRVRGRVAANNSEVVLLMARRGLGLALLADWLVRADLARGRLLPVLETHTTPPAPIYALRPPGRFPTTALRRLIDHLETALQSSLTGPDDPTSS